MFREDFAENVPRLAALNAWDRCGGADSFAMLCPGLRPTPVGGDDGVSAGSEKGVLGFERPNFCLQLRTGLEDRGEPPLLAGWDGWWN